MAIVNPFDLLGDDDTDPTELTGLHEEIIKKTKDEKEKAREEQAQAKALAEKEAKKYRKYRANVEKSGLEPNNGGAGRGYARNGQNNWENSSGRGYGNNRNYNGYSGGYDNAVGDWVNNNYTGSYHGGQNGGYRNREGGASYGKAPRQQNYNNGNAGGNYEVESQNGKGNGRRMEETLEDGFIRPPRKHVIRQSPSLTGSEKFLESSTDQGTTKTAVNGVLTKESLEISKTENNTSILEEVKKDQLPASDANNEEKEKKEDELAASEANNEQKLRAAEDERRAREAEEERKKMTLIDYEKILEEKRKPLLALMTTEERKVQLDKEFQSMQQLSLKNQKDGNQLDEKMKKLSGRTTDSQVLFPQKTNSQGSVKGEKEKEEAKRQEEETKRRQELLRNVRNVLRRDRYQRPKPQNRESDGGQIGSDNAQSVQGPQRYGNRPQSARGYGGQTSSDTLQSNGNQGNGNRPQSGRAQSNRNQGFGIRYQSGQGSKPQKEASALSIKTAPSIENSAEFPPLKIVKN